MPNYALLPYENDKGLLAVKTSTLITQDIEIDTLEPIVIPPGTYDGTTVAKLSSSAAAEVVATNIRQGAEILGVQGSYEGIDTLGQYFDNTLMYIEHSSVTSLLASLFERKTALQSVDFDAVESIGNRVFYGCTNLISANFPNATSIGNNTFNGCTSLTEANFPNVTSLGDTVFSGCASLIKADFPNAQNIPGDAFYGCTNLVDVNIPNAVFVEAASVQNHGSFAKCTSLENIILPLCAEIRGRQYAGAFLGCAALNRVDVGVVCKIFQKAFFNCNNLTVLILRGDSVSVLENISQYHGAFVGTPFASNGSGGTLYVPQALIEDYQAATNWSVILSYPNNQILPIEGSEYEITEEAGS